MAPHDLSLAPRCLSRLRFGALAVTLALAQQPEAAQTPQFKASVDMVTVDVTVMDKRRQPVRGLTADDFTLLDNGVPQTIQTFTAVEIPPNPDDGVAQASDIASNNTGEQRLFVMVIDDGTLPFKPIHMRSVREAARNFVSRLGPNDLTALIFTRDNRYAQDFTQDKSLLLAAIERTAYPPSGATYYGLSSVNALGRVAEALEHIPARRKAIAYFSIGLRLDTDAVAEVTMTTMGASVEGLEAQYSMMRALRRTVDRAQRANVAIYPVDPSGVAGMGGSMAPEVSRMHWESLQMLADLTGGRAAIKSNDLRPGVERIFTETRVYYLLGYVATPPGRSGGYRRVEVKMKPAGLEAHTRKGYFTTRQDVNERAAEVPLGLRAISGVLPDSGIPLKGLATPFFERATGPALALTLTVDQAGLRRDPAAPLTISTHVFDPEGRLRREFKQTSTLCDTEGECELSMQIPITPGRHALRVSVQHEPSGRSGSLYLHASVPEFGKDAVSLTGLALESAPVVPGRMDAALRGLLPVVPTARREFKTSASVAAFFRIHQSGRKAPTAVTRTVVLADASGTRVWENTDTLTPAAFTAAGAADQRIPLPIAGLAPGRYELSVTITKPRVAAGVRQLTLRVVGR